MEIADILLLDDGELSEVAAQLDRLGLRFLRVRGGESGDRLPPPRDLLITTPRRASLVRRGSPPGTPAGRPVRIIGVEEDSTAMRRMLRRMGFHLLVRLPSEPAIWQLLIRRALYQGDERRSQPRVALGAPVSFVQHPGEGAGGATPATLLDISNRGCRLVAGAPFALGGRVTIDLPAAITGAGSLSLAGTIMGLGSDDGAGGGRHAASLIFDEDLGDATRVRLVDLINRWSLGPPSIRDSSLGTPPLPACESKLIPGLTLDDETDPAIRVGEPIGLRVGEPRALDGRVHPPMSGITPLANDRREHARGAFTGTLVARSGSSRRVLLGRDLSAGGMRIERVPGLAIGESLRIALYGPSPLEPFEVSARVIRDGGDDGLALAFEDIAPECARSLEKLVACLPEVESLEEEESHGMGAILSEILD